MKKHIKNEEPYQGNIIKFPIKGMTACILDLSEIGRQTPDAEVDINELLTGSDDGCRFTVESRSGKPVAYLILDRHHVPRWRIKPVKMRA